MRHLPYALAACASFALASPAAAETFTVSIGEDLISVLENLQAGDEVIVNAGTYETGGFVEVIWLATQ